jgi:catechol 2,3-dioxygenase-like lactoylglutathione lyase family enzyme
MPGKRPDSWSSLMIELMATDFPRSLGFWTGPMGFRVVFDRPGQQFVMMERPEGAQMMLYQADGDWQTGALESPLGRGAVIQVYVADVDAVARAVGAAGLPFYVPPREKWRDWGDRLGGQREFLVQDPDGYLVMVVQRIGERPA